MKTLRTRKSGFTLVEMLVVVTLIAIVATIAIALLGGASRDAAETVNSSNMKQLTSNLGAYMQLHDFTLPDRLDSLMNATSVAAGGSYTTLTTGVIVADSPETFFYIGLDANRDGVIDSTSYTSKGLNSAAYSSDFRSLTVTQLTSNDVSRLASIGITTVYDVVPATTGNSRGNLFHGEDNYSSRTLKVGDPVCTLDPASTKNGKYLYDDFGFHDIYNTTNYPISGTSLTSAGRGAAMAARRFLVFGIGRYSTIVGDRKAGLQEPPKCKIVNAGEYNRYLLVVKLAADANDLSSDLAGVLDPTGKDSRAADSWATRTGN